MPNLFSGRCSLGPLHHFSSPAFRCSLLATLPFAFSSAVSAQDSSRVPQSPAAAPASGSQSEISSHDPESTFKLHVNLVSEGLKVATRNGVVVVPN